MDETLKETAANWWAEKLEIPEKRKEFKEALIPLIHDNMMLKVDYDPCDVLLEALHKVGIECFGMFSADGILPYKTIMKIKNGTIKVAYRRGAKFEVLEPLLKKVLEPTRESLVKELIRNFRRDKE